MTITEIKARLFELQYHVCNGSLAINPDGSWNPANRPCSGCDEYLRLTNLLKAQKKLAEVHVNYSNMVVEEEK